MYLRWQSRYRDRSKFFGHRLGRRVDEGDVHRAAIIVESVRIAGKPTQRHVAYLGGITDSAIAIIHQRCWFWDEVKKRLDHLGNRMSPQDRERIEAAVATKVPRPTKAQYDQCVRDRNKLLGT